MGTFLHPITLIGPAGDLTTDALVDTGATFTLLPRPDLERLGVQPIRTEPFEFADGRVERYELGVATARLNGKEAPTLCVFGEPGAQALLGAYTLEGLMLGVDPVRRRLVPLTGWLATARPLVLVLVRTRC